MTVEIQVLGALRVTVDGRAAELGPTRRRALLAAVTIDAGRVVPVDVLADRVWDGRPPTSAAGTIHAYVSRLRSSVRSANPSALVMPLVTRSPGYLLDVPADAVDAERFETELRAARELAGHDPEAARVQIRRALDRWDRDTAYADVPAEFARVEAERLQLLRVDAYELAVDVDLALGLHEQLVPELSGLVRAHPLRERLHASLMTALYRSGRQAEALAGFGVLRDLLADELGVDPGPAVSRLQQQILQHDPALEAPPTPPNLLASHPAATPGSATPGAGHLVGGDQMVGRARELGRLQAALAPAAGGRPVAVSVVGEAGIGKSRLVEEVTEAAALAGDVVVWGRCWQHEGAPVLWPWVQALEALAQQVAPPVLEAALAGRGAGVRALAPDLPGSAAGAETGPGSGRDGSGLDQVRLYDAVTEFLRVVVTQGPVLVLVLEDMHWADRASRELTEYLLGHLRSGRLALVVTVRTPAEESSRAGSEILTSLARSGRSERVDVAGLDADAVSDYVANRTGSRLDRATAVELADRTGGNPFFVAELIRLLITDETSYTLAADGGSRDLADLGVPDSVREVINRRLSRLPAARQSVLQVAAVIGRTFDLDVLAAAAVQSDDDVDEAVDQATELGIVQSEPRTIGRHRFVHALTQQALLDTIGPARVRRLHGRVAAALGDVAAGSTTATQQLAYHLGRSGGQAEIARAVGLCSDAADRTLLQGNYPETEALLLQALDLTARLSGPEQGGLETRARVRLWLLYTFLGGPGTPQASAQRERTVELVRRHGSAVDVLALHQAQYARLIWFGELDAVEVLLREMSRAAEAADDDLMRAAVHLGRGEMLVARHRIPEALQEYVALEGFTDVLRTAPAGVFPSAPHLGAPLRHAIALTLDGQLERAAALAHAVEAQLDGPAMTVGYVHIMLAFRLALVDDAGNALRHAELGLGLADRHGLLEARMFVLPLLWWARERLDPGSGLGELEAALDATRVMSTMAHRPTLRALLADVSLRAGRPDLAARSVEAGLAEAARTGDHLSLERLRQLALLVQAQDRRDG